MQLLLRDVTAGRKLEERLRQAQKLESMGVFAGGIAHDFNNLLTAVLGNVSLLEADALSDSARTKVGEVRAAAERASTLTRSMLAYSGRGPVAWSHIDLNAVVRDLLPLVQAATTSRTRLEVEVGADPLTVHGDEAQLTQVVLNLLTNAADAQVDGGRVHVRTEVVDAETAMALPGSWPAGQPVGDRFALITVADEGTGIDDGTLERIFDPFFSTRGRGRGLGLSAVLGIVRSHGGGIAVDTQVGVGTTMYVLVPVVESPDTLAEAPTDVAFVPAGMRVLVVDDQVGIRRVCRLMLEGAGYEVEVADGGASALQMVSEGGPFHAVVLDETMPGLSGAQTVAELRILAPELPVLRTSGFASERVDVDAWSAFLAKPYTRVELLGGLARLLAR